MIGLIFIGIGLVYLVIVIAAPVICVRIAKNAKFGTAGVLLAGIGGFLLVTAPIFWDWVPTVMTHSAYCKKDAGVFVYKTVEQWKQANPGVAETLTYKELSDERPIQGGTRYFTNQRIAWDVKNAKKEWGIDQREESVVDLKTGQVLVLYRDYSTGVNGSMVGGSGGGFRDWKIWMSYHSCEPGDPDPSKWINIKKFNAIERQFKKLGRKQ